MVHFYANVLERKICIYIFKKSIFESKLKAVLKIAFATKANKANDLFVKNASFRKIFVLFMVHFYANVLDRKFCIYIKIKSIFESKLKAVLKIAFATKANKANDSFVKNASFRKIFVLFMVHYLCKCFRKKI
jgi:hypothetical protein